MSHVPASSLLSQISEDSGDTSRIAGQFDGNHILVPLVTPTIPVLSDQLRVAAALTRTTGAKLHVTNPVTDSDEMPAVYGPDLTPAAERELLEWAERTVSSSAAELQARFRYTRRFVNGILRTIRTNDVDSLVVPSGSKTGMLRSGLTERLALRADYDVITVNGQYGFESVPSILLAVSGGPHTGLATDLAKQIAADSDAWIDVLHVVGEDASTNRREQAEGYVEAAYRRINRPELTTTWTLEAPDVADAIIEQSAYYGLTIIGAPTKGRLRQFIGGSTNQTIRDNAQSVVISARKN